MLSEGAQGTVKIFQALHDSIDRGHHLRDGAAHDCRETHYWTRDGRKHLRSIGVNGRKLCQVRLQVLGVAQHPM